jgi:transposase
MEFRTTVVIEVYRVWCPDCGIKTEKVPQLPSKAPFSKRFEDAVGEACESAAARQVARRFGMPASTVRAIDLRYLERWAAARRKPVITLMGVDEIHLGERQKFITVVSNLESGEPVWFGRERKKETLDELFQTELSAGQRMRISAACVDLWEPFRLSLGQWAPRCRIVCDKFHIMQHANQAIDEVRRAEFFRKGGQWLGLVKDTPLPVAQGATHGRHQGRIHRFQESSLKCGSRRIPAQSQKSIVVIAQIMYVMPTRTHRKQCLYKGAHTEEWRLA